jgi:hypothetical protein
LFKQSQEKIKMQMFFIDIPLLHESNAYGKKFIQACYETKQKEIFESIAMQALVNWHWQNCKWKILASIHLPYCLMLFFFKLW